jgi:hypothetical protein
VPRKRMEAPKTEGAAINHEAVEADSRLMDAECEARRHEIIERYADGTPYNRELRLRRTTRFYIEHGARAMLETGKGSSS